jgi:hypothetical protein
MHMGVVFQGSGLFESISGGMGNNSHVINPLDLITSVALHIFIEMFFAASFGFVTFGQDRTDLQLLVAGGP